MADLLQKLGSGVKPAKIRNFGWDAVKLSDLSMEDLATLREQVQAEHANPRDATGRYLESGQPSLYLYDKKGRWKLDKLAWAVTHKLAEKRRSGESPEPEAKPQYPLYQNRSLFHGTALPFTSYTQGARRGSGYDHQGKGFYLTSDKRGYARFFAIQAADRILNGPTEPEGEEARILESGGVILNVTLDPGARIIDLTASEASPELKAMVSNVTEGSKLRERVMADGHDGVAFIEPNSPEGWPVPSDAVTVVLYSESKATVSGHEETGTVEGYGMRELYPDTTAETGRAPAGGTVGLNGEFYKGGTFLPNTTLPKQGKAAGGAGSGRGVLIEPGVFADSPSAEAQSIFARYGQFIHVVDGVASVFERPDAAIANFVNEDVAEGRAFLRAAADAYNKGLRWFVPGDIEVTNEHREEPAPQIVEHVTKGGKGKTIRGIIRTDLTYAEAKAIDEYTFKKDGGWFIREKHLDGYVAPEGGSRPAPTPKPELSPEEQAQAEADRLANEQAVQSAKRAQQAAKLREVAASTLEKADASINQDRNTNTARRARMASGIIASAEADRALALTMNNLAGAIERGQATHLAGITSRAAVQSLQDSLRNAMYEAERGLSYAEQQKQKGRAPTLADVEHAKIYMPKWGTAGTSAAKVLEAIKGKKGSVELAKKIRFSTGPDAETVNALKAMIGEKETAYQIGWWNLEQVAKVARLKRLGITNDRELKDALAEYLQFREGAREEDPIKKAERAIIGQKVGIDFFPTPAAIAVRMASLARIKKGDRVLEPSAGNGNLADAAKSAGAEVDVIEISSQLREILTAKGYTVVAHDFDSFTPEEKYDAVLMNPPFSNRQDAAHIRRAFDMVKAGGHLVAIAGEGVFFGSDAKAVQFRDWLYSVGAEVEQLGSGTFMDKSLLATTGANARLITIQK
ncbi:methyltransferase domain-containing protein [Stutzerimonas nitrititolerans]|uniref:methyltransferase domain-containing protein n=1 Tax=Stutzerimonas nitrititolerans TaxID=2482751 RepID=UPI0028AD6747|nr:methyltransferase domain-containing protein [Stutzerimonas nitrititolerans]